MNREIKFRGKTLTGEWVYGYYVKHLMHVGRDIYRHLIIQNEHLGQQMPVIPETVGQYTGLKDKNGKEVYEKDLSIIDGNLCEVKFDTFFISGWEFKLLNGMGCYSFKDICKTYNPNGCKDFEIIGNIIDNTELITP
jgi:hypothetical protein